MQLDSWQPQSAIEAVIFDCDSTLSAVEGITVLAELNGVFAAVHELTEKAMADTGVTISLYQERLDLVKPKKDQMQVVVRAYWQDVTPDVGTVIKCLQMLGKTVYVASAGILQPVVEFAAQLNIPADNVYAVPVYFDADGNYKDFDRNSRLVEQNGKSLIVEELRKRHKTIAHIGDGMNDIEAAKAVDRFVGYGGSCFRQSIADLSDYYITSASMAPLFPLLLSPAEAAQLTGEAAELFAKGCQLIEENRVIFN